jgi:bacterioferritin-associated ferredoxin
MDLAFEGDQQRPIGPMVPARQLVSAAAPKFLQKCINGRRARSPVRIRCALRHPLAVSRSCGTGNTPGRKFCGECGALLDQVLAERLTQQLTARLATTRLVHAE